MINASVVREHRAVQDADTTPLSERYGYKVAATHEQITAARVFSEALADDIEKTIDEHFRRLGAIGENPYRDKVVTERQHYASGGLAHATRVDILTEEEVNKRHGAAFKPERPDEPMPIAATLFSTAIDDLRSRCKANGFELYGPYARDNEGGTRFVVLRDPEYVKAREQFARVKSENAEGRARDRRWWRRLAMFFGAKPFQELPLPSPGPKALPAPAPTRALPAPADHTVPPVALPES